MYLERIRIRNLKLLRDFRLETTRDGRPRMWTVLIGENGLCKTSVLRAIALAASGHQRANQLAEVPSLADRRQPGAVMWIDSEFTLPTNPRRRAQLGDKDGPVAGDLKLNPQASVITGQSRWRRADYPANLHIEPIEEARSLNSAHWLVVGYGTSRLLPRSILNVEAPSDPAVSRLLSLFDRGNIIGTGFAHLLAEPSAFESALRRAIVESGLLPEALGVELTTERTGRPSDAVEAHRLDVRVGRARLSVPTPWLSQGYQSTIAWVADLIGQAMWDQGGPVDLDTLDGLVLVDELDLHLHPKWQVDLIPTLKRVFPRVQFIVTTHSPMVLPGLEADEIVRLRQDDDGNVVGEPVDVAPALMTGSEIYRTFFGIDKLYPTDLGQKLQRFGWLVGNAARTDAEEAEMITLRGLLANAGVDPGWEPLPRDPS